MTTVHPASQLSYPPPVTLAGVADAAIFGRPTRVQLPPVNLCTLPHARIYGRRLAVINDEDRVIESLSREYGDDIRTHFVFSRPKLPRIKHLKGTTCFLGCMSGNNYYHFLFDCLPILDVFARAKFDLTSADHFVFTGIGQPFQQEILKALGIPLERVVETDRVRHIEAERLVCPSTQILSGGFPRWACEFLRDKVAAALLPNGVFRKGRRIYVSREDAEYRRITNSAEIDPLLLARGFEKVVLGRLSVREQVEIFAGASVVVAPHGAGLANIVFSPEGTTVVELFAPEYQNPCYYELCCTAGHRYRFLLGETKTTVGKKIPEMTRLDMIISPEKLESVLRELSL